jgi:hypothetical protein
MIPDSIYYQVETREHGVLQVDLITFSGDYAILIDKEIKDGILISTETPVPLDEIIRITTACPIVQHPNVPQLLTEEDSPIK